MRKVPTAVALLFGAAAGVLACGSSEPTPCQGASCGGGDRDAVFVAPDGADTNPGTKEAPVATVRTALRLAGYAQRLRVVLAEGKYTETAPLVWVDGVNLEGGYARATWAKDGGVSELSGASTALVATRLAVGGSLARVVVRAQSAPAPEVPSVALWVSDLADGKVFRVEPGTVLSAGAGGDAGKAAEVPSAGSLDGPPGVDGRAGSVDGENDPGNGGAGGRNLACPVANGGPGGSGGHAYSAYRGLDGRGSAGGVAGGKGAEPNGCSSRDGASATAKAGSGKNGLDGAPAAELGAWDEPALRYLPPRGAPGTGGEPGQGGGGGGGGSGQSGTLCNDGAGSGGGGGGAGGCGGPGGPGGGGGGPSVALFVTKATVVADGATLMTERGGAGGAALAGGVGGAGGAGGAGGTQGAPEIGRGGRGEAGGAGGRGGAGGAGSGGPSVGIWVLSGDVKTTNVTLQVGPGGAPGTGPGGPGKPGRRADTLR